MENKKRLIYLEDALSVMPALEMCTSALKKLPTADATPVVHGRWIKAECSEKDGNSNCSECGHWDWDDCNYCSKCGARMDGERIDGE